MVRRNDRSKGRFATGDLTEQQEEYRDGKSIPGPIFLCCTRTLTCRCWKKERPRRYASRLRRHGEIKVISYNIRWRSGDDLKKIIKLFKDDPEIGGAAILCLQEVDRRKKRSGHTNTAKLIADELGMHYAWAAPPAPKPTDEEETGVAILSVYPLSDVRRIVLPHEGPGHRRRVALGATVEIDDRKWRVYSAHSETRIAVDKKLEQFKAVLDDLAQLSGGHARDRHGRSEYVGTKRGWQDEQVLHRCGTEDAVWTRSDVQASGSARADRIEVGLGLAARTGSCEFWNRSKDRNFGSLALVDQPQVQVKFFPRKTE